MSRITDILILAHVKDSLKFQASQGDWKTSLEILDLSHCNLLQIENLDELPNLRIGVFSNN